MSRELLRAFGRRATDHLERVLADNAEVLTTTAERIVTVGRGGGLLYAAGAGHSLAGVIETFYRAGGLAFVRPLWRPELFPLNGAVPSTRAEREVGLGAAVVREAGVGVNDAVVVFSNSGVNPYPVEVAEEARRVGAWVLAVTSLDASRGAPKRADRRLAEVADDVVDTRVPAGDVTWPPERAVTSPISSLCNAAVWSAILAACYELDPELPWWHSANVEGSDTVNADTMASFAGRIPELGVDSPDP